MSPDKSLLVGVTIRDRPGLDLVQNGILVLQRQPAPVPLPRADAVGRWDLFSLQALNDRATRVSGSSATSWSARVG